METSVAGVFAAGDARADSTKQLAAAVGEGTTAAFVVPKCLEESDGSREYKGD